MPWPSCAARKSLIDCGQPRRLRVWATMPIGGISFASSAIPCSSRAAPFYLPIGIVHVDARTKTVLIDLPHEAERCASRPILLPMPGPQPRLTSLGEGTGDLEQARRKRRGSSRHGWVSEFTSPRRQSMPVSASKRTMRAMRGALQLEIWNAGPLDVKLQGGTPICQFTSEIVDGTPEKGYDGRPALFCGNRRRP